MRNLKRMIALFALTILFVTPIITKAQNSKVGTQETGETISVVGSSLNRTIEATGNENINIEGSSINVVITGNCNSIKVTERGSRLKHRELK